MTEGRRPRVPVRQRRDRRGRGVRGPLLPVWCPGGRVTREDRFRALVTDAAVRVIDRWGDALPTTEFTVDDVPPPGRPADPAAEPVPLGRVERPRDRPRRIVLYRRPIERRAGPGEDREDLVADVMAEQVADLLGLSPETVDPDYPRVR